jgi:hypothetical protein
VGRCCLIDTLSYYIFGEGQPRENVFKIDTSKPVEYQYLFKNVWYDEDVSRGQRAFEYNLDAINSRICDFYEKKWGNHMQKEKLLTEGE